MNRHGIHPTLACPIFSEFIPDFAALEHVALPSAHTVMLIAADAREVATETIARAAERLLANGLIYICIWGPDCKRVHDMSTTSLTRFTSVKVPPSHALP